jgi:hypothetical protein
LRMGTFCNNELGVLCSSAKTPSIVSSIVCTSPFDVASDLHGS